MAEQQIDHTSTPFWKKTRIVLACLVVATPAVLCWQIRLPEGQALRPQFLPGHRLTYRCEFFAASTADFGVLMRDSGNENGQGRNESASKKQALVTNLKVDLQATTLSADDDSASVAFVLCNPDLQVLINGELALGQAETIRKDLRRLVLAEIDRFGRIRSIQVDPRVSSLSNTLLRTLLANTQAVSPPVAGKSSWEAREGDPNGEFTAQYTLDSPEAGNVAVCTKVKVSYLPRARQASLRQIQLDRVVRPTGRQTVRFDMAAGNVLSIKGKETTTILVDNKTVARTETTLDLQFRGKEELAPAELAKLLQECETVKAQPAVLLSAPTPMAEREAALQRNELGDATADSLLRDLERLDASPESGVAETPLYLKLKALVYLHPEVCPRLASILATAKPDSHAMQLLSEAFSSIGHTQAQTALQTAIKAQKTNESALAVLVTAVAMVDMPNQASEEALRQLAADSKFPNIRASAELGLGTMAHILAAVQPRRAAKIVRDMTDQLTRAQSDEARRQYLFVLGNAGLKESLPAIQRYVADSSPQLRGAAVAALRWIDADPVDPLLCKALTTDPDSQVRIEAATALGFRTMNKTSFAAQKESFLQNDASISVRLAVMPNLARAAASFPEGRELLKQALRDPSEEIRDQAAALLAAN